MMFCYQCQETLKGEGCTLSGVCGKSSDVAGLQDVLMYTLKGISIYGLKAKDAGIDTKDADNFIIKSLFSTITNVNFDVSFLL